MAKISLSGPQATMLATLYGKALDAQSANSILHDTMALHAVEQIDFDKSATGLRKSDAVAVALRSLHFDNWTREFLAAHPEATVLHLGCGLDTRVYRIDPGPGIHWYDIDFPDVIDLRPELYPTRPGYELLATPLTPADWLDRIPADLPVLVVAEGVTMYLHEAAGRDLFRRIVDRFPSGQFLFDGFSRAGIKVQKINPVVRKSGSTLYWGIDTPADLESIHPRLHCRTTTTAFDHTAPTLTPLYRLGMTIGRHFPVFRRMAISYRLDF
ncbi:class I SAM-dependent methyltransferase [Nocardia sp. NPDC051832]|uniref:class I SAM-dependent methyltransferase n=1 Tax=Nocardia sp. NPDC051832 TaxID=3155673 RepID=UPI00342E9032